MSSVFSRPFDGLVAIVRRQHTEGRRCPMYASLPHLIEFALDKGGKQTRAEERVTQEVRDTHIGASRHGIDAWCSSSASSAHYQRTSRLLCSNDGSLMLRVPLGSMGTTGDAASQWPLLWMPDICAPGSRFLGMTPLGPHPRTSPAEDVELHRTDITPDGLTGCGVLEADCLTLDRVACRVLGDAGRMVVRAPP